MRVKQAYPYKRQGDIPIKDIPLFFIDFRQNYAAVSVDSFFFSGS